MPQPKHSIPFHAVIAALRPLGYEEQFDDIDPDDPLDTPSKKLDYLWSEFDRTVAHEFTTRMGIRYCPAGYFTIESVPMLRIACAAIMRLSEEYETVTPVNEDLPMESMWAALDASGDDDVDYACFHADILHALYICLTQPSIKET